jgi:hypothetical protein
MVVRLPGAGSGVPTPAVGFPLPTDPRRDMIRELIAARLAAELSDAESKLTEIVQTGEARSQQRADQAGRRGGAAGTITSERAPATTTPTSEQVQRALQLLQREAGLPVTGRFDDATAALLVKLGLVRIPDATPKADAKPAEPKPPTTEPKPPTTTEPKAERKPIDLAGQAQRRQAIAGQEQLLRARLAPLPSSSTASRAEAFRAEPRETPLDRALDPARLLASLVAAGFQGPSLSNLGEALQAFQVAKGLPPSGQLDRATAAALGAAGVVSAEAASAMAAAAEHAHAGEGAHSSTSAASTRERVDVSSNTKGSGAASQAATTRAPAASPEEARERARLESLLAQAEATERGVQAGDPAAVVGHAPTAGQASGVSGSGGTGGGADTGGDESAHDLEGASGDESSVGNSAAGDDDHDDDDRGEAVAAGQSDDAGDADDGLIPDGHYRVEKLSVQVLAALETIARLDDDGGPVHYTWDVTLYRPGVYADGQPAEAVWHLVVDRAHAFDPVWERATHAIAARLLYVEPEADAPSLDDVLGALRRARVR